MGYQFFGRLSNPAGDVPDELVQCHQYSTPLTHKLDPDGVRKFTFKPIVNISLGTGLPFQSLYEVESVSLLCEAESVIS